MNNKKIKIAIIDDGVNVFEFQIPQVKLNIEIDKYGFIKNIKNYDIQINSHGTICSAIIQKYLNHKNVEFVSIKILDTITKRGTINQLIYALNWCIYNDIDVINCSFGTIKYIDFNIVKNIINKTSEKGIIIVSAINNNGIYSLPACLNNVIGVKNDYYYNNGMFKLRWYPFDDIEITTSGTHELIKKNNIIFKTISSNSFATPMITAYVSDIIFENGKLSHNEILLKLEKKAKTVIGKYISGIVPYIWNIPQNNYDKIYNNFDFKTYNNIISKYLKYNEISINIPIVNICGLNFNKCLDFIFKLSKHLEQDNFYYRIITEYFDELKYGFVLFPQNCDKKIFCNNIFDKFKNEILILHLDNNFECDITIKINNSIVIYYNDEISIIKTFDCYFIEESVNYVYNLLIQEND